MTLWSCVLFTLACSSWHKLLAEECEERLKHSVNLINDHHQLFTATEIHVSHKRLLEKGQKCVQFGYPVINEF